jgi:predicted nucleic acid-binding protein
LKGFLLDTNILSALRQPARNKSLVNCLSVQPADYLHVSEVSLSEIRHGIERQADLSRRADLQVWLDQQLRPRFDGRVHAVTEDVLLRWLMIQHAGKQRGHVYSQQDVLIAAIAAQNELIVMTGDETHFVKAGVPTLDPFASRFFAADGTLHQVNNLVSATLLTDLPG